MPRLKLTSFIKHLNRRFLRCFTREISYQQTQSVIPCIVLERYPYILSSSCCFQLPRNMLKQMLSKLTYSVPTDWSLSAGMSEQ